jgi:aryl-alcohol dehydrogenase-like predicted oxidoreductase
MDHVEHGAFQPRVLGRTGLSVGAMGISASYGVPTSGVEEAFEHGVNYLYWGSMRRNAFGQAIRNLAPQRDRMVLVIQSYSRFPGLLRRSFERALRQLKMDHADILLLGMWNHAVPPRMLHAARDLKRRGLVRFLAASTHNRPFAASLGETPDIDVLHVRYNAVHRGAEQDIFPHLPATAPQRGCRAGDPAAAGPGIVGFTATSWRQLLGHKKIPPGERVPTATDCYRFVLSNPAVSLCMSGPKTAEHVKDVIAAIKGGPMSEQELAWMRRIGDAIHGR